MTRARERGQAGGLGDVAMRARACYGRCRRTTGIELMCE